MADVQLVGVTKRFGAVTAVDEVDLQIADGRVRHPARAVGLRQDDDAAT